MNDFRTIEDYKSYINRLPLRELKGIAHAIDKYVYPEKYRLLCELIREKDDTFETTEPKEPPNKQFPPGVSAIRNIHIALVILLLLATLMQILLESIAFNAIDIIPRLVAGLISLTIIVGISQKKEWVVLLVLISSYLRLFVSFAFILTSKNLETVIMADLIANLLVILFACYQIYVFSKERTKEYFGERAQTII